MTPDDTRGPSDANDSSSTQAPETKAAADERDADPVDPRLHPGGAHGTAVDPGMSSIDPDMIPSVRPTGKPGH